MKKIALFIFLIFSLAACSTLTGKPVPQSTPTNEDQVNLPNPASVYCEQQGYQLEIRTAADGSQSGFCIFPDGSECEEWAYYKGECTPAGSSTLQSEVAPEGWTIYHDEKLGFSFFYPIDCTVEVDANGTAIFVTGPVADNNAWPAFAISFPSDRAAYLVPSGTDLRQWLIEHDMYAEQPQPDRTIAGTTAIHTRFPGGGQSFAHDSFFFVNQGHMYLITIEHAGGKEDWDLYHQFLDSFQFIPAQQMDAIPTAPPINPADYQGWWAYTHSNYGFSIMLPEDWVVEETTTFDPQMNGHSLNLHPKYLSPELCLSNQNIRMNFRRVGEEALLWPTGVGQGEFIPQGTLEIAGIPALRLLLVCPSGEVTSIWYHQAENQPNILRGDLEFGFIFSATPFHCEPGYSLSGKNQLVGEMIIASLEVP
jgi:putative hemolysin